MSRSKQRHHEHTQQFPSSSSTDLAYIPPHVFKSQLNREYRLCSMPFHLSYYHNNADNKTLYVCEGCKEPKTKNANLPKELGVYCDDCAACKFPKCDDCNRRYEPKNQVFSLRRTIVDQIICQPCSENRYPVPIAVLNYNSIRTEFSNPLQCQQFAKCGKKVGSVHPCNVNTGLCNDCWLEILFQENMMNLQYIQQLEQQVTEYGSLNQHLLNQNREQTEAYSRLKQDYDEITGLNMLNLAAQEQDDSQYSSANSSANNED